MDVRVHYSPQLAKTFLKLAETHVLERSRNRTGFSIQRIIYEIEIHPVQASGRFLLRRNGHRQTNEPDTKDEAEAITLLNTKNEATRQPAMNRQIAQVYLQHADPTMAQRLWQNVMDAMFPLKTGPTQARWQAGDAGTKPMTSSAAGN